MLYKIQFSVAATDCELTSASHLFGVLVNYCGVPYVEHFGKNRFCSLRGAGLSGCFICATRRLGGNAKCGDRDTRFWRDREMLPNKPGYRSRA
jgi:hypothetical protein